MAQLLRRRFWAETVLGTIALIMLVITLISREWIEVVFGLEPDGGSGAFEWALVAGFALAAVIAGLLARYEWLRAAAVGS